MYIFIDESGVHKKEGKSSIALVYLSTENISSLERKVIKTESSLGIASFHWAHSSWPVRKKFIEALCKENFSLKIAFIKNPFHESKDYEYALAHLIIEKDISNIIIDGRKSKTYERKIKKILRDKGISVKKLKTANDEAFPALRVADAIAGVARCHNDNPEDERANDLYAKISAKILITLEE